ncbi:MAG: hypothetical protein NTZ33_01455 [Bacteroidetes bacterium]|nr:hypothetical protein [Bacteroidota bacterium]
MEDIFVPLSMFGMVLGIVYLSIRKKERMALLQKGLEGDYFDKNKPTKKALNLKYGLLSLAVGAGILIARIFEYYGCMHQEGYFAMIFLLGGISLILYYFLEKKLKD